MEMKELLRQGIDEALKSAVKAGQLPAGEYPDIVLEVPPQKEFGDFATAIAMQSARVAHRAPRLHRIIRSVRLPGVPNRK